MFGWFCRSVAILTFVVVNGLPEKQPFNGSNAFVKDYADEWQYLLNKWKKDIHGGADRLGNESQICNKSELCQNQVMCADINNPIFPYIILGRDGGFSLAKISTCQRQLSEYFKRNSFYNRNDPWTDFIYFANGSFVARATDIFHKYVGLWGIASVTCHIFVGRNSDKTSVNNGTCYAKKHDAERLLLKWYEAEAVSSTFAIIPANISSDIALKHACNINFNISWLNQSSNTVEVVSTMYNWESTVFIDKFVSRMNPHLRPSQVQTLRWSEIFYYGEFNTVIGLSWSCPKDWNGEPNGYTIDCMNIQHSFKETAYFYGFYFKSGSSTHYDTCINGCFKSLDRLKCDTCWEAYHLDQATSAMVDMSKHFHYRTDWHKHQIRFRIGQESLIALQEQKEHFDASFMAFPESLRRQGTILNSVMLCKVRAVSKNGPGIWSEIAITRITATTKSQEVFILQSIPDVTLSDILGDQKIGTAQWQFFQTNVRKGVPEFLSSINFTRELHADYFFKEKIKTTSKWDHIEYAIRHRLLDPSMPQFNFFHPVKLFRVDLNTAIVKQVPTGFTVRPMIDHVFDELLTKTFEIIFSEKTCFDWWTGRWISAIEVFGVSVVVKHTVPFTSISFKGLLYAKEILGIICRPRYGVITVLFKSHEDTINIGEEEVPPYETSGRRLWCNNSFENSSCTRNLSAPVFALVSFPVTDVILSVSRSGLEAKPASGCTCILLLDTIVAEKLKLYEAKKIAANLEHFVVLFSNESMSRYQAVWNWTEAMRENMPVFDIPNNESIFHEFISSLTLKLIPMASMNTIYQLESEVKEELLDNFHNYPSHMFQEIQMKNISNFWLPQSIGIMQYPISCFLLQINKQVVTMIGRNTATVSVSANWNDSVLCTMARPPVVFHVIYRNLVPVGHETSAWTMSNLLGYTFCTSNDEESIKNGQCTQLISSPTRNLTRTITLDVDPNRIYEVEAYGLAEFPNITKRFIEKIGVGQGKYMPQRPTSLPPMLPHTRVNITQFESIYVPPKLDPTEIIAAAVTVIVLILFASSGVISWLYRKRQRIYADLSRIKRSELTLGKLLGKGNYCSVYQGTLNREAADQTKKQRFRIFYHRRINLEEPQEQTYRRLQSAGTVSIQQSPGTHVEASGHIGGNQQAEEVPIGANHMPPVLVAIKSLKIDATDQAKQEFLEEAIILGRLKGNKNIIEALGICLDTKPRMLVLEFATGGSLLDHIKSAEARASLCLDDLLQYCVDASTGCSVLEDKGYIHRDIAARNFLLFASKSGRRQASGFTTNCSVKLADFGLAKDSCSYKAADNAVFSFPWAAPECLRVGKFSIESDVWSFGVLIYEVFSWGAKPFGSCGYGREHSCPMRSFTNAEISTHVGFLNKSLKDLQDPCSAYFPAVIREIMCQCWYSEPSKRLKFKQLKVYLEGSKGIIDGMRNFPALNETESQLSDPNHSVDPHHSVQLTPGYGTGAVPQQNNHAELNQQDIAGIGEAETESRAGRGFQLTPGYGTNLASGLNCAAEVGHLETSGIGEAESASREAKGVKLTPGYGTNTASVLNCAVELVHLDTSGTAETESESAAVQLKMGN